jgi:hypothetical protein
MDGAEASTNRADGEPLSWPAMVRGIVVAPRATLATVAITRTWPQAAVF